MDRPELDINVKTPFGYSILHTAAQKGSLEAARILEKKGYTGWNDQNDYLDAALHLV